MSGISPANGSKSMVNEPLMVCKAFNSIANKTF